MSEEKETEEKVETAKRELKSNDKYAGFWIRFLALIIDGIIIGAVSSLFNGIANMGSAGAYSQTNTAISSVVGWVYAIFMINKFGATLGKMALGLKVVDSKTLAQPTLGQIALREIIGKFISGVVLGLGFLLVAFDSKKQGWHDKIASTYVLKK